MPLWRPGIGLMSPGMGLVDRGIAVFSPWNTFIQQLDIFIQAGSPRIAIRRRLNFRAAWAPPALEVPGAPG